MMINNKENNSFFRIIPCTRCAWNNINLERFLKSCPSPVKGQFLGRGIIEGSVASGVSGWPVPPCGVSHSQ